jgi:pimeloyl-ACP methyl ester carboxylesterase
VTTRSTRHGDPTVPERGPGRDLWPFCAGLLAGGAGALLVQALFPRRVFDPRLLGGSHNDPSTLPVVVIPGILGSELRKPDGTRVWLNVGNAFGSHELGLPPTLPPSESHDDLIPGGLLGVDTVLPRLFGFTEYVDLIDLLMDAGFRRAAVDGSEDGSHSGARQHVFTYDWRRELVASARVLHTAFESLAKSQDDDRGFNVIGHSMGGLIARYYLRYGTAEPGGPVTWAGARHIRNLILVATPNAGSVPALEALLFGERVGLSSTTLAAPVITRMPSIYTLLPHQGSPAFLNDRGDPLDIDVLDPETWKRFAWGPFTPSRRDEDAESPLPVSLQRDFLSAALLRARAVQAALSRTPETPCPIRVVMFGGDCLPTLSHALMGDRPGVRPRFQPRTRREAELMFEGGDGRVTRTSVLASHLPCADEAETGCGLAEVSHVFFGDADHHGIYGEVTFQSLLLRLLLRPPLKRTPELTASGAPERLPGA